jgi:hypothetical protein
MPIRGFIYHECTQMTERTVNVSASAIAHHAFTAAALLALDQVFWRSCLKEWRFSCDGQARVAVSASFHVL